MTFPSLDSGLAHALQFWALQLFPDCTNLCWAKSDVYFKSVIMEKNCQYVYEIVHDCDQMKSWVNICYVNKLICSVVSAKLV